MHTLTALLKFRYLNVFFILILVCSFFISYSQDKMEYGKNTLRSQSLKVEKYNMKVTPILEIDETMPSEMKLSFKVEWWDKKSNLIQKPEKIDVFINVNDYLTIYGNINNKKVTESSGLLNIGKKEVDKVNSISITPIGVLSVADYQQIHFRDKMPPITLNVIKKSDFSLSINLQLYIGKEKSNTIELDGTTDILSWYFYLPEDEPEEQPVKTGTCDELVDSYTEEFNAKKPPYPLSYFETNLSGIENTEPSEEELRDLNSKFLDYKLNRISLNKLKYQIENDPDYKKCKGLMILVESIDNCISDPQIEKIIEEKISTARLIAVESSEDEQGSGEFSSELFLLNYKSCENIYNQLLDIDMDQNRRSDFDVSQGEKWLEELNELKQSEDSMYELLVDAQKKKKYHRQYKGFQDHYNGAIELIEELTPESNTLDQSEDGQIEAKAKKSRKIPWSWILFPVLAILLGFGVYKYFGYLKKGKSIDKKLK